MKRRALAAALALAIVPPLWSESRQPRFLTFSAKDQHGLFLRDLKPGEVTLLIDKEPVEVRYFGHRDVDTALAFIIENSPRTAPFAVSMPQYGRVNPVDQVRYYLSSGYCRDLLANGSFLVAEFYRELNVLQDFTDDEYLVSRALENMKPHAAGLDRENIPVGRMIGRGLDLLRARSEKRKALVLFTASVDRESPQHLDEYRQMLRLFDIDLYVVSFASRAGGIGRSHAEQVNSFFFRQLVGETSGRFYLTGEYVFLDEFMDDLRTRLANSYTLGFYIDSERKRSEYEVELRIERPNCEATYRRKLVF